MEHHLTIPRTARYEQLGELSAATRQLWLVAHGYGQLAEYFSRHFESVQALDPEGTVIVAPEALSRFYRSGTSGYVGASWMTTADRLAEIADQAAYLDALLDHLLRACPPDVRVTVLGFSQGTATVSRWLAGKAGHWRPQHLVLWAGDFPADIEASAARQLLHGLPVVLVSGELDGYVSPEKLQAQAETLGAFGAQPTIHSFEGKHTIYPPLLRQLHAVFA
ncbi:alpha/beta hydrolase [Hymenobacter sp. BT559]|uniref:alpha/beta hydrolase n=1 Tax=Hymenobacter sp. BT559 TaxID=2795729 RepID=UPI0018EBDE7A|nr:phospholipase [Hymenobacter sp. BT559]MBJ6144743.1 phospholipase [Hymenobacter sp. BT559]